VQRELSAVVSRDLASCAFVQKHFRPVSNTFGGEGAHPATVKVSPRAVVSFDDNWVGDDGLDKEVSVI